MSNTYENMYEDFSSNYDDSACKSNDDLTEFYLYNEINNHKYNNNLYDFYLSKFNKNAEEKQRLKNARIHFMDKLSYLKKKEKKNKDDRSQ